MEKSVFEKNLQLLDTFDTVSISNISSTEYEISLKYPHYSEHEEYVELLAIYNIKSGFVGFYIRNRDYSDTRQPKIKLKDFDVLRDAVSKLIGYKI